jgi:hypothetical protein
VAINRSAAIGVLGGGGEGLARQNQVNTGHKSDRLVNGWLVVAFCCCCCCDFCCASEGPESEVVVPDWYEVGRYAGAKAVMVVGCTLVRWCRCDRVIVGCCCWLLLLLVVVVYDCFVAVCCVWRVGAGDGAAAMWYRRWKLCDIN